ncbi:MAG: hypothetical protein KAI57_03800 [Candidatus Pacebacteria bacterium]|nr:hypothetical protein [Candidatus Paceibacterota bacterium]
MRITCEATKPFVRAALKEVIEKQINFQKDCVEIKKALRGQRSSVQADWLNKKGEKFIVASKTESLEFNKAALHLGATIIIKENKKGQIQIFTQKQHRVNIARIAAKIRADEYLVRNSKEFFGDPKRLFEDGTIDEVPIWHLFEQGGMLLNGSLTTPDQTPTALSLRRIVELIIE